jgi:glycosyltransferase involved in cell wall biosynthesis
MEASIRFSVIMPTYNKAAYLAEAIDSVLCQTYSDWELIIVDNFSTDETSKTVNSYSDERIKFFKFSNAGIIAASRNFAISKSVGDVVAFLDSDDLWEPAKLQKAAKVFNEGADFTYHDVHIINEESEVTGEIRSRSLKKKTFLDLATTGNIIVNSSVCVRSSSLSCVEGISENRVHVGIEDFNTWLKLAAAGFKFVHTPLTLGSYRVHGGNFSAVSSKPSIPKAAYFEFEQLLTDRSQFLIVRNFNYFQGVQALRIGDYAKALDFFNACRRPKATLLDPKIILRLLLTRMFLLIEWVRKK